MSADDTLAATEDAATSPGGGERRSLVARGDVIGRYVVLDEIGAGGMGVVYAAYDPELDRKVAIKLLHADGRNPAAARARLQREGQAMAKLSHPNVANVHDVGTIDDRVWLAMEFVAGDTLTKWLTAAPRSWREVVGVFTQVGRGLAAAHSEGLLHRDVKPDNMMIDASGRARILDFGLARAEDDLPALLARLEEPALTRLGPRPAIPLVTRPGAIVGTPSYMAPERFEPGAIDARADQFAFCVALWEGLYGERPFVGETIAELTTNITRGNLRAPPRAIRIPGWVRRVLHRGLAVDPGARWPSMHALLDALDRGHARSRIAKSSIAIGIAGSIAAAVFVGRHVDEQRRVAACEATSAEIDEAWSDAHRQTLRAGLLATHARHAETTADKVMPWLDEHANAWKRARVDACLDAHVTKIWDADTLDRSLWCLDERRMELQALVNKLSHADARAVTYAVSAAASLRQIDPCRDTALLARLPAPPTESREEVQAVLAELSHMVALYGTGAFDESLRVGTASLERAEKLGWPPLIAFARTRVGSALKATGQYNEAEAMQESAYFAAIDAGTTEDALFAARDLTSIVGYRLRRVADGERWNRHAEALRKTLPDAAGLREARGLSGLALVRKAAGAYQEAASLEARVLAIRERALGPEHPDVAQSLNNLAGAREETGAYEEAAALHERALSIREKVFGPEHPEVAQSLNNLARVRKDMGAYDEAIALHERARSIRETVHGPAHPLVAQSMTNLADVRLAMGAYDDAVALHERALAIREDTLGPDHPDVALSLNGLGKVKRAMGAYDDAVPLHERALAIREKALGPAHVDVAASLNDIGAVYAEKGLHAQATASFERALAIREQALGHDHPDVATTLNDLATVVATTGAYEQAAELHERALAIRDKALGREHPTFATSLHNLAGVRYMQGRYEDAAALEQRALSVHETMLGPEHPLVAHSLNNLAILRRAAGDLTEAAALDERALAIRERVLGPDHPDVAQSLHNLANVHLATGAYEQATTLLERALAIREKALGPDHTDVAQTLNNLANAHMARGSYEAAASLHARALAIRETALGPNHPDVAQSLANLAVVRDAVRAHENTARGP